MSAPATTQGRTLTRVIVLMAFSAFASGASLRVSDPLLPQVAQDFGTSLGAAATIVTAYAMPYGLTQAFSGLIGDRLGKCQAVAAACALSCLLVLLCAVAQSVPQLALARFISAPGAAIIVPLGMAYVGDAVPYARRQTVLARYLAGQMTGMIAGQVAGGIIGDHFGWRSVFVVLAFVFAGSALALASQVRGNPFARPMHHEEDGPRLGMVSGYRMLLAAPWTRFVLLAVFVEAGIFFGGFTYVAADLHGRFGLSFSVAGTIIAGYGIGSVLYALSVQRLVEFGERGMVLGGGIVVAFGFVALAAVPFWELAPLACTLLGFGYYMVHNTLQTNATQMLPESRATAVAAFSSMLFLGQSAGVALAAPIVDRAGAVPVFISAALLWPALAWWIRTKLKSREIY